MKQQIISSIFQLHIKHSYKLALLHSSNMWYEYKSQQLKIKDLSHKYAIMIQLIRMRFLHLKYFNVIYTELKENTKSLSLRPTDSYQPPLLIVHSTKLCLPVPAGTHL